MEQRLFSKDFTMVVIGQIISLFGNAVIRFALPLYLLNLTGSSALYGIVTACAFIPAILLSPVGGIIADRVNKRNIMVILDFSTAALIFIFWLLMDVANIIALITAALLLLYGIASAYQPSVQASIPALVDKEKYMPANAVINMISSLASLLGPVLGGILYSAYGLLPVLWTCGACFIASAIMEIFIKIPHTKIASECGIFKTAWCDFTQSLRFICKEKSIIGKVLLFVCGLNLFLSAMIIVGLPYIVTEILPLQADVANTLYGYAEGAFGAGGLLGGLLAGALSKKMKIQKSGILLVLCAAFAFPSGIALFFAADSAILNYITLTLCCFLIMFFSTIFTIQTLSFVQTETPQHLIGKVISVILTVSMCAQPLGYALYGVLFEICAGYEFAVFFFAGILSILVATGVLLVFRNYNPTENDGENK